MSSDQEHDHEVIFYHLYLNLPDLEDFYRPFLQFLGEEFGAGRVAVDYPVWYFRGRADSLDLIVEKIGTTLDSLVANVPDGGSEPEVMWRVLLMHPSGHSGFGRGYSAIDEERLQSLKNV